MVPDRQVAVTILAYHALHEVHSPVQVPAILEDEKRGKYPQGECGVGFIVPLRTRVV